MSYSKDVCCCNWTIEKIKLSKGGAMHFKNKIAWICCVVVANVLVSCESMSEMVEPLESSSGVVVRENPREMLSFEEVKEMEVGDTLLLFVNRTGTKVVQYEVEYRGVTTEGGERLIVARVMDNAIVIGNGDSGSPLVTKDGEVIGALCYGYSGDTDLFIARAIGDLNGLEAVSRPRSVKGHSPVHLVQKISGISREHFDMLQGGYRSTLTPTLSSSLISFNSEMVRPSRSVEEIESIDLLAGMSIEVAEIRGDLLNYGAVGTISNIQGDTITAFGHAYNNEGIDTYYKPVYIASMLSMVNTPDATFKLSNSTEAYVGTLVNDAFEGIVIRKDEEITTIPIEYSIRRYSDDHDSDEYIDSANYMHELTLGKRSAFYQLVIGYVALSNLFGNEDVKIIHSTSVELTLADTVLDCHFATVEKYDTENDCITYRGEYINNYMYGMDHCIYEWLEENGSDWNDIEKIVVRPDIRKFSISN